MVDGPEDEPMIQVVKEALDVQINVTQLERQHRCRATPIASCADIPGRYPYESS